ncbi:EXD2 (predicted), partial [Pycnogonum litorale]
MPHMDANMTKNNLFFPVLTSGITIIGCFLTYRYIQWLKFSSITKYSYKLRHKEDFICTNIEEWSHHEQDFLNSCKKFRCLGLDCEWVTKGRSVQKVALLQLATYSGICVLLRLCHLKERLPENLLSLLNDRSILKVGVACCDDAKKLRNDYGIIVNGCLDLRHIITRYPINEEQVNSSGLGLKHLAKRVLNENINKDWWIQCGDWEATILSNKQIEYAVQDAVIAVDIFNEIMKMKILRDRRLLLFVEQTFFGSKLDVENYWNEIIEWCRLYIDVPFTSNKIYRSK